MKKLNTETIPTNASPSLVSYICWVIAIRYVYGLMVEHLDYSEI